MVRLQNNPSIRWVHPKSTHVHPLAWGNNKEELATPRLSGWLSVFIFTILKTIKEVILVYNKFLKFAENIKQLTLKPVVHCRIFHENHWLFKVSEITGTGTSSILIIFSKNQNFSDSGLIFKALVLV
jgi:hypothetical protein